MKRVRRFFALFLCLIMLIPSQELTVLAETQQTDTVYDRSDSVSDDTGDEDSEDKAENERIEETLPLEPTEPAENERIEETLPLEPVEEDLEPVIYWNPGNEVVLQISDTITATPSEGRKASLSELGSGVISAIGKDSANGLSPEHPVRTLNAAIRKAEKLADKLGVETEDVIIYAMNPMEVEKDDSHEVKGRGITLASWPERSDDSDLIFCLDGGKLILRDINLEAGDAGEKPEETELIRIDSGKVQLGADVQASGSFVLNFTDEKEGKNWLAATASGLEEEAEKSEPVIELLNGFTAKQQFYLTIQGDREGQYELVRSLFADDTTEEEFLDLFSLSEYGSADWKLVVKEETEATVRNTDGQGEKEATPSSAASKRSRSFAASTIPLTRKTLMAAREADTPVYWNPGGPIKIGDITYPEGLDGVNDGSSEIAPVKTWEAAKRNAHSRVIICMQPINLSTGPDDYIGNAVDGVYHIDGGSGLPVTIKAWERMPQPAFVLPEGTSLELENVTLEGAVKNNSGQLILLDGGDLYLKQNVKTDNAYIQTVMSESSAAKNHTIFAEDADTISVELYYTGINDNIGYRYTNVVAPYGALATEAAADPDAVGQKLLNAFYLSTYNSVTAENGGKSEYAWTLRPDTAEDDMAAESHILELYADFYYDAVYINGVTGSDDNYGATCAYPVKTFARAKEILEKAISSSVAARGSAAAESERSKIAYPKTIYICDTVTVADTQNWNLSAGGGSPFTGAAEYKDYDGTTVKMKVQPHLEARTAADGTKLHDQPLVMVRVTGELTLEDIAFRNPFDAMDAKTISVAENGKVTLDKETVLSGEDAQGNRTFSQGIEIETDAELHMNTSWSGRIEKHRIAVNALGGKLWMAGGEIADNGKSKRENTESVYGAGIVLKNDAQLVMTGGIIRENNATHGAGVFMAGSGELKPQFKMSGGKISKNTGFDVYNLEGGGVYLKGGAKFVMEKNAVISDNKARAYSSNAGGGVYLSADSTFEMLGGTIKANGTTDCQGGGIYAANNSTLLIRGGEISENKAARGGGIYYYSNRNSSIENVNILYNEAKNSAGGIQIVGGNGKAVIKNSVIKHNTVTTSDAYSQAGGIDSSADVEIIRTEISHNASAGKGGGIACFSAFIKDCQIIGNTAKRDGGGIYAKLGNIKILNSRIEDNRSESSGGGIYTEGMYIAYLTDSQLINNQAAEYGGGISGAINLNESAAGKSSLKGNTAKFGGGIHTRALSNGSFEISHLDIAEEIQNSAVGEGAQGSNVYCETPIRAVQGSFQAAEDYDSNSGVYNIFVKNYYFGLDPQKVRMEGEKPLYLSTANSYVVYFNEPAADSREELPISVSDEFSAGSVVIKAAGLQSFTYTAVNPEAETSDQAEKKCVVSYPAALFDASIHLNYSRGGRLPERCELGGYKNPAGDYTDVVLIKQGIYLDGKNGNDQNDGLSPTTAVKTLTTAKQRLESQVDQANSDTADVSGFIPIIYICGQISVTGEEVWELDYEQDRYVSSNYVKYEVSKGREPEKAQIRRFAANAGNSNALISVESSGRLTLNRIIMDNGRNYIGQTNISSSNLIYAVSDSEVILNGDAQLVNSYDALIMTNGNVTFHGEESQVNKQLGGNFSTGVHVYNGKMEMTGFSGIDLANGRIGIRLEKSEFIMKERSSMDGGATGKTEATGIYTIASDVALMNEASIRNVKDGITSISGGAISITDFSVIENSEAGVFLNGATNLVLTMDKEAKIKACKKAGILLGTVRDVRIVMKDQAVLETNGAGIHDDSSSVYDTRTNLKIEMYDRSSIRNNQSGGISIYNVNGQGGYIQLGKKNGDDTPSIVNNGSSIRLDGYYKPGSTVATEFRLEMNAFSTIERQNGIEMYGNSKGNHYSVIMNDSSRITTKRYGIDLKANAEISLNDHAVIGSEEGDGCDGPGILLEDGYGVTSNMINLSGNSQISHNAGHGIESKLKTQQEISLTDAAEISSNKKDGIFLVDSSKAAITLHGESRISKNESNQITLNGTESTLSLLDNSRTESAADRTAVYAQGSISLAGTATVTGIIDMRNHEKPITLLSPVAAEKEGPKYHLNLAETFGGMVVVRPDGQGITDASTEIGYFTATAEGSAKDRVLLPLAPDIVLSGENNVYISGTGNDANLGNSPATSVRTFRRAKELLENGYYTAGANILISGEVPIIDGDTTWSFGPDGSVTNHRTNDVWIPKVMRYRDYTRGVLLSVKQNSMGQDKTFTLDHVIIDGNGEEVTATGDYGILQVDAGCSAYLGEGAVIQNSSLELTGAGIFVEGNLTIDGGIIENNRDNSGMNPDNYGFIFCRGSLDFISGKISNNTILGKGLIYSTDDSQFRLTGGVIQENINQYDHGFTVYLKNAKASMEGGFITKNQTEAEGSAIYYEGTNPLVLSGGRISGNISAAGAAIRQYSPVYVAGDDFRIHGGGCDMTDPIYLTKTSGPIKLSNNIYQTTRRYTVYLNEDSYTKGSVVVQPDHDMISDASPYLENFEVRSGQYILDRGWFDSKSGGTVPGVKENKCLLLMKPVFIDSDNGSDSNTGLSPANAVKTFNTAVSTGLKGDVPGTEEYFVIYASGPMKNSGDETWSLSEPAYVCRYTGFPVYGADGGQMEENTSAYYGQMIIPEGNLTLDNIRIYGRRSQDDTGKNGDTILSVSAGVSVTMSGKSALSRNYNIGNYLSGNRYENLSSKGGAVYVEAGGTFQLEGGRIEDTAAAYGGAVYLAASENEPEKFGHFKISSSPLVTGSIYLDGTADTSAAYLEPAVNYVPAGDGESTTKLTIAIRNDYDGRPIVKYPKNFEPGYTEAAYYQLEDAMRAVYDVANRPEEPHILELKMRTILYLDGERGSDRNDGSTPEQAVQSIRRIYELLRDGNYVGGAQVYVCGNIKISDTVFIANKVTHESNLIRYSGTYRDGEGEIRTTSQVYFKRYVQPTAHGELTGYGVDTYRDTLFTVVNGGDFTVSGIYFDGHSEGSLNGTKKIIAPGTEADGPLLAVMEGGKAEVRKQELGTNEISTRNLFTNNVNRNSKKNIIGQLEGIDIREGSSAGIEILGGECIINGCDFMNLRLGEGVAGGSDVYQSGTASVGYSTVFGGSVFLEGFGTSDEKQDTSRYLNITAHGTPVKDHFDLLIRDQYPGRTVVVYPDNGSGGAPVLDIPYYHLNESISKYYALAKRVSNPYVLELSVPAAVYVDGVNGDDNNSGSNPKNPIQTMKQAYEKMNLFSTRIVYIVDKVSVKDGTEVSLSGNSYRSGNDKIILPNTDKVEIRRYVRPDFAQNPADDYAELYAVDDYLGELFEVEDGAVLNLNEGLAVDGHGKERNDLRIPERFMVSHQTEANMPLIVVKKGGTLNINEGAVLSDNYNRLALEGHTEGGAVLNHGTTYLNGGSVKNNQALKGAGIYQDGTFIISQRPEGLGEQEIYLTSDSVEDSLIHTAVKIGTDVVLNVNMDHAVKGRDVVRFLTRDSYAPNADADQEYVHFRLGDTVPKELFLVKASKDPEVLELQNWEILDVEVPKEVYLVVQKRGPRAANVVNENLASPVYKIRNHGIYDISISLTGFLNDNAAAGITYDPMNLVGAPEDASGDQDLYLAVRGDKGGAFALMGEVALGGFTVEDAAIKPFGRLQAGSEGAFSFTGTASETFTAKYMDSTFPYTGKTEEELRQYIKENARAKFKMTYKVQIDPERR